MTILRPGQTGGTDMGREWDAAETHRLLEDWVHRGIARHSHMLGPDDVARVVQMLVSLPRGTHVPLLEVQPEATLQEVGT